MKGDTNSDAALTDAVISKNATIIEEGILLCPVCRSEVKAFLINFNESILICENQECFYPFGFEEAIYLKEDYEKESDDEVASLRCRPIRSSPSATYSMVSSISSSDIEKLPKISDTDDSVDVRPERKLYYNRQKSKVKIKKKVEENKKIQKQLEAIKKLNVELIDRADYTPIPSIKNEKWIRNLMGLQKNSGIALLKPEELKLLNKPQPASGLVDLKINIDVGSTNNMSSINIAMPPAQANAATKNCNNK